MDRPLQLDLQPTDLVALARGSIAEQQAASERHRIVLDAEPAEVVGQWDATRLGRVLGNLLENAVKYSPAGGEVRVEVRREAGWAVVRVADQGLGIPAADLPHIFERFRRAGNVVGQVPGTGLGLAVVRQIVEQLGGSVDVDSQAGLGSTFTVRLPLPPAD
jgi:signal transduction histidine kinase